MAELAPNRVVDKAIVDTILFVIFIVFIGLLLFVRVSRTGGEPPV
jgi:hypothetical protein